MLGMGVAKLLGMGISCALGVAKSPTAWAGDQQARRTTWS